MDLADLLTPDRVVHGLRVSTKKQALQDLSEVASRLTGLPERGIFDALLERERLGTTGVGQGIAIPHAKLEELPDLFGFFASLDTAIDFESIDEQPVDLVFLLLAPGAAGAEHLKALARVSRLLRNQSVCEKLRAADNRSELYALLTESTATAA